MFRSLPVNHTLGSSCGATTVHYEERVGERHLVVITVTFETDSDVGSGDVDVDVDIYIMVKCLSVCLSVTKNDHFL